MEITVNGTPRTLAAPTTVAALLEELQVDADTGIAVLLNGDVI
ncbi:MAG: sulfur carrier protein ThiS, partial [Gammaproteobacteria bacterium]|nr:sulfur carrier protein ThiS [Gammaproteobacteria bacterium]NIR97633.1 sulfur carrier protein ThiS [Gammaproteobacteria bacterium]NIT63281.1 sulfur carrier protein ThiS [Gammaproteobacteria bacterium]NIV19792.1 sulfur carrier protein ThiS [Gammaproteobacteria bacterium]NIY31861.1 sulfur carrier protein ThiS [Gammaproteobacteria bacterium]